MKFAKRWRVAGLIASEVRFQGFLDASPGNLARVKEYPERISRSIKSSRRTSAIMTASMVGMLAFMSVFAMAIDGGLGSSMLRLVMGLAIFLGISFAIVVLFNLNSTTGFFTANVMDLPASLPLSQRELENLTLLAFVRVFIAPVVLIVTVYPVICLVVFGIPIAVVSFVACAVTVVLSIGMLISIAKWFHQKAHSSANSRLSSFIRILTSLGLAVAMVVVFGLGSLMPILVQVIDGLSMALGPETYTVLALVYPLCFGFLVSGFMFSETLPAVTAVVALGTSLLYVLLAVVAYRKTGHLLRRVALGGVTTKGDRPVRGVFLRVRSPLRAVIHKDLKLASRNIGSAFIFAMPLFLVVMMVPALGGWLESGSLRSLTALIAVEYGNFFGGIAVMSVMMFDTQGASVQAGLPLSSRFVLKSKAVIAMVPFVCSMVAVSIMLAFFPVISPLILLISLVQIPSGYTIGMAVGSVIYRIRGQGRAVTVNVISNPGMGFVAAAVGGCIGIIPLVGYGVAMIISGQHVASLLTQLVVMVVELVLVLRLMPRVLRD